MLVFRLPEISIKMDVGYNYFYDALRRSICTFVGV